MFIVTCCVNARMVQFVITSQAHVVVVTGGMGPTATLVSTRKFTDCKNNRFQKKLIRQNRLVTFAHHAIFCLSTFVLSS